MSVTILGKEYPIATTTKFYLVYKKLTEIPEIDGTLIEDHFYGSNQDNQLFSIFKFEKSKLIPLR